MTCLNETLQNLHTAILEQKMQELREFKLQQMIDGIKTQEAYQLEKVNKKLQREESILLPNHSDDRNIEVVAIEEQNLTSYEDFGSVNEQWDRNSYLEGCELKDIKVDEAEVAAISNIIGSTIHLSDPFQMTGEAHDQMRKLALMCFQLQVHGNPSEYVRPHEESLTRDNEETGGIDETFTAEKARESKTHEIKLKESKIDTTPVGFKISDRMEENNNLCSQKEDEELGQAIKCYFHLYKDAIAEVIKVIEKSNHPKYERWEAFLQCLTGIKLFMPNYHSTAYEKEM